MNLTALTRNAEDLKPALAGSALLHLTVAALFLIAWPWSRELKVGAVVPVKIVTNAPVTDLRPAIEAPVEQEAMAETPVPEAPPEAAPPTPVPQPEPPAPAPTPPPKPTPTPKAATPAPKPAPPQKTPPPKAATPAPPQKAAPPKAAEKSLDFDALLASVSKNRPSGGRPSAAPRGPSRPETATQARPNLGAGASANALQGLTEELQRRWNPNCDVEGGRDVRLKVTFNLGAGGQVVGQVTAGGQEFSGNSVIRAAAERAIAAVNAASPFRNLPHEFYGQRFSVNFDARNACSLG